MTRFFTEITDFSPDGLASAVYLLISRDPRIASLNEQEVFVQLTGIADGTYTHTSKAACDEIQAYLELMHSNSNITSDIEVELFRQQPGVDTVQPMHYVKFNVKGLKAALDLIKDLEEKKFLPELTLERVLDECRDPDARIDLSQVFSKAL